MQDLHPPHALQRGSFRIAVRMLVEIEIELSVIVQERTCVDHREDSAVIGTLEILYPQSDTTVN